MADRLDYRNKNILAPMVRIGSLPFRLLALDYGADIVYSEELIAPRLAQCDRIENDRLNTIDFVKDGIMVYQTCAAERHANVVQLGAADAISALAAAKIVARDVAGIDLNMGCPKPFSVNGGMGAALLDKPEVVHDILTTLVRNLPIPVTAKMRLHPTTQRSIDFAKMVESTGVSALAIHARMREERPRDPAHWNEVASIVASGLTVPTILSGDVWEHADFDRCRQETGVSSVMAARGATKNPSIFRAEGTVPLGDVLKEYCKKAIDYEILHANAKYVLLYMADCPKNSEYFEGICGSKSIEKTSTVLGLTEYLDEHKRQYGESVDPPTLKSRKRAIRAVIARERDLAELQTQKNGASLPALEESNPVADSEANNAPEKAAEGTETSTTTTAEVPTE